MNLKRISIKPLILLFFVVIFLPAIAGAASIWDGTGPPEGPTCNIGGPCGFCDALKVVKNIITFLFEIAIPIAVAMIVYGAIRMMIAGGSKENVSASKKIMTNAFMGMVIALGAWIIVNTILHILSPGGVSLPWNQINCTTARVQTTPPPPGSISPPPPPQAGAFSEQGARAELSGAGITVNKNPCPPDIPFQEVPGGCTSLHGIRASTIRSAIDLKNDCGCSVVVTGGTELGHAGGSESHASGAKLDFQRNPALDNFIETNYQYVGVRSDGARLYRAPSGAVFAKEHDHWDAKGWEVTPAL